MERKKPLSQVFFYSLISYMGMIIGVFSTLFVYPYNKEFLGIIRYIESIAQMLSPVIGLGVSQALIHFYPSLTAENKKRLFNYSLFSVGVWALVVLAAVAGFSFFIDQKTAVYLFMALFIGIALAFTEVFKKQAANLHRVVVPTLFEKLLPKIVLPLVFGLLFWGVTSVTLAIGWYALSYGLILVLLAIYVGRKYRPGFDFRFRLLFNELSRSDHTRYSLYSFAGSLGSFLAFRMDSILITEFISFEANGTYTIGFTVATALAIPATGLFAWYAPVISNYLKNNSLQELGTAYREYTKILFMVGALFYSCLLIGLPSFFAILPARESLDPSLPIIFILGGSVLLNMATGFNTEIISYSRYYRFNLAILLGLVVLNLSLNLFFLTQTSLGIIGVAWASLVSMALFNGAKAFFIYKKLGLSPYDGSFLKLLLVFLISGTVMYLLPPAKTPLLTLFYKVSLNLALTIGSMYRLRLLDKFMPLIRRLFQRGGT